MDGLLKEAEHLRDSMRPLPFWSWNEQMEPEVLKEQVDEMARAGLGGFFMHARVGLKTPYMGERWFECVKACIEKAEQCGIKAWGYDENGYPSGIAGGAVCEASVDYQSSWLEFIKPESEEQTKDLRVLALYADEDGIMRRLKDGVFRPGCIALCIKSETRASDPLNAEAVGLFINLTHKKYREHFSEDFGRTFPGFFTDEPQLKMFQLPWTAGLDNMFKSEYGYDLLDHIFCLVDDIEGKEKVRFDYWSLINRLYCESFGKRVSDWCRKNGLLFTGHIMGEDTILEQMASNAGAMPFYEYMDIPGMDWLGRRIGGLLTIKQVASASAQLGKKRVLSETFALSGWDVYFRELKWMAEWQMANGITLFCPHLQSYSLKGIRKRDYPPSLFVQQSWWPKYRVFNDYISSLGGLFAATTEVCDLLVLHPLTSAYLLYEGKSDCPAIKELDKAFLDLSTELSRLHISFHYGDETLMKKYAKVEGKTICIGSMRYSVLLLPELVNVKGSTAELIVEFMRAGGRVYRVGRLPDFIDGVRNPLFKTLDIPVLTPAEYKDRLECKGARVNVAEDGHECSHVVCMKRERGDERLVYIVNTDLKKLHNVACRLEGFDAVSRLDPCKMEAWALSYRRVGDALEVSLTLRPGESAVLLSSEGKKPDCQCLSVKKIAIPDELSIERVTRNHITIDRCDYSVDGGEWNMNVPVIKLQKVLLDAQRNCDVALRFSFEINAKQLPKPLYLLSENIPDFAVAVNGVKIPYREEGYDIDPAFKRLDISHAVIPGKNEIILTGRFWQRPELIRWLYREKDLSANYYDCDFDFESVTYDTELESIYLIGDFCVVSKAPFTTGERRAVFTDGPFVLTDPVRTLRRGDFTQQGFLFFAGSMTVGFDLEIEKANGFRYCLDTGSIRCPVAAVYVNGNEAGTVAWEDDMDITAFLRNGKNHIAIELFSGLRNLLGPHHYIDGESYSVGVSTFTDTPGWCENRRGNIWSDRYCFVNFGFDDTKG